MLQVNVAVSSHWHGDELCLLSWEVFRGFSQIEGKFRDNARLRHSAYLPRAASFIVPLPTIRRMAWDVINVTKITGIVLLYVYSDVSAEHALSTFSSEYSRGTVITRLTKIIRSGITFVSRNVISRRFMLMLSGVSLLDVSNVNNPVGLVGLPYVMWSAHFFVTHIQTEKISYWNGPTVHVCCFMLARASTKTFVSRIHIR